MEQWCIAFGFLIGFVQPELGNNVVDSLLEGCIVEARVLYKILAVVDEGCHADGQEP